jgi:omega-6 fatty acid desaturase (delta-12 desaturase)
MQRLPIGLMGKAKPWISTMGTNIALVALSAALIVLFGFAAWFWVQAAVLLMSASLGVWLFYVQHQFEDTYWAKGGDWEFEQGALTGSSHFELPGVLRWFTANIGVHHVHHLASRIPFYRMTEVLRDHPELVEQGRLTLRESLGLFRLTLWDENRRKLVPFSSAG